MTTEFEISTLSEVDKQEIILARKNETELSTDLKAKLLLSIKNGEPSIFNDAGNELCCDLGIDQPDRYQWTTFDNCRALGGRAADNSKCGH